MTTPKDFAGQPRRDLLQAYLVIDGPDAGNRRAWPKDSFVIVEVLDHRPVDHQPPTTYRLRRHAQRGLVWASEESPALTDPYED